MQNHKFFIDFKIKMIVIHTNDGAGDDWNGSFIIKSMIETPKSLK